MNKVDTTNWAAYSVLGALLLFLLAAPVDLMAQDRALRASQDCVGEKITLDNGITACASTFETARSATAAKRGGKSLSTMTPASSGSLTTLFAANNAFAGNTFDVTVNSPLIITGFDVNIDLPGTTNQIDVYWRLGSSVGVENNPASWTPLGSDPNVISAGDNNPSSVNVGGLLLVPGQVYGFYIDLASYLTSFTSFLYTNGGPNVYSNADMNLTTNTGQAAPAFSGSFFPRQWNGTIYYESAETDLALYKNVDFDEETQLGSYHIVVSNLGPSDASDVEVTDYLPELLIVRDWDTSQGDFNPFTGLWEVGDLAVGESDSLWIYVEFLSTGRYTNRAEITNQDPDDSDDSNNEAEVSALFTGDRVVPDFVPGQGAGGTINRGDRFTADLTLDKTVNNETPAVGEDIIYSITVENLGPQSTAKVEVTDHLPDCLTYVSSDADRGAYDPDTWIWTIGKIKVGEAVTLYITATVTEDCSGEVVNHAEVTKSSLPDPDDQFNIFDDPPVEDEVDWVSINVSGRALGLDGTTFALGNNYPNPFNPMTLIPYSVAEVSHVSIKVYDLLGRSVATLVDGTMSPGVHEVSFDASSLPTGMYLVRMEAGGIVKTMRVTLMK